MSQSQGEGDRPDNGGSSMSGPLFDISAASSSTQQPGSNQGRSSSARGNNGSLNPAAAPLFNIQAPTSSAAERPNNHQISVSSSNQGNTAPLFSILSAVAPNQRQGIGNSDAATEPAPAAAATPLFSIGAAQTSNASPTDPLSNIATRPQNLEPSNPIAPFGIAPSGQTSGSGNVPLSSSNPTPQAAPLFNISAAGHHNPLQQQNIVSKAPPLFSMGELGPSSSAQQTDSRLPSGQQNAASASPLFTVRPGNQTEVNGKQSSTSAKPLFSLGTLAAPQNPPASTAPSESIPQQQSSAQQQQQQNTMAPPLFNIPATVQVKNKATPTSPNEDADAVATEKRQNEGKTGWLVTACDVGTTEPQSLSQELERLQVLKSYHILDPERDESFDRITTMASRVFGTPFTFLSLVDMGRIWFRCNPESEGETQFTRDTLSCCSRVILKQSSVFVIPDTSKNEMYRQCDANAGLVQFRFFAGAPLVSPEGYRLGAICMLGTEPRMEGLTEDQQTTLKDFAELAVKTMVDRRKLTTQGNPSHLVAATAHDLITPLTGIQLSLSLLQQDSDFQGKLGEKRKEFISAAVSSSNMMLRICQSTIETLRGNRKLPNVTDWSLPRNLMHIAESSPFIDMRDFVANLEVISNSIPKRVPVKISLRPDAPTNIISDGLKIFRSALNILSNACSRTEKGSITFIIYDDREGSLVFECADTGKDIEVEDGKSLFSQEVDASNFGLYSVAYQINWLGGKYGYRKRESKLDEQRSFGEDSKPRANESTDNVNGEKVEELHGSVFWFSIPIVLPQDVSELMGLARSLTDENGDEPISASHLPLTPPASPQIEEYQHQHSPATTEEADKGDRKRKARALIIEDSSVVRKILARALSKLEYQVYEALDGMEGLRELKNTMFDLVLCDFLMPVMDGLDCVQQYREWERANRHYFKQYIVGVSAHASRNDIERGLKLGMNDFKPKPIVLKTLTALHESAPLKNIRTQLDELMNFSTAESNRQRELELKLSEVAGAIPEKSEGTSEDNDTRSSTNGPDDDDGLKEPAVKKPKSDYNGIIGDP